MSVVGLLFLAVYVNVLVPLKPAAGVYVNDPSPFSATVPPLVGLLAPPAVNGRVPALFASTPATAGTVSAVLKSVPVAVVERVRRLDRRRRNGDGHGRRGVAAPLEAV